MFKRPLVLPGKRDLKRGLVRSFVPLLNLVFDGNSIPRGFGLGSPTTQAYPHLVYNSLVALGWDVTMSKVATDAIQSDAINTRAAATVDVLRNGSRTNMVLLLEGTNYLSGGASAAAEQTQETTYVTNRLSAGWDFVVMTTMPPWSPGTTGDFINKYGTVNTWLRGGSPTGRSLFDLDAALLADGSNPATPTSHWQADKVHPSAYGHTVIAAACVTAIQSILGVS
jgi:lysophospholipase L1-like esterase